MREGAVNEHVFKWMARGLTCERCGRGARNQKYWLNITQERCRGVKPSRDQTLKAQLASRIGVEQLEGGGPWADPYTRHRVALVGGAWECCECGRNFGQAVGRLGPRQRRCPGEARQEVVRRVNPGRGRPRGGRGAAGEIRERDGGRPSVLALLGAGTKREREPVDLETDNRPGPGGPPPGPDGGGESGGPPAAGRRRV